MRALSKAVRPGLRGRLLLFTLLAVNLALAATGVAVSALLPEGAVSPSSGRLLALFLTGGVLLSAILTLGLTRLLRPLGRLAEAVSRGERTEEPLAPPGEAADEVGSLASAVSRLQTEAEEYQLGLEQKVEQRTRELVQSSKEVTDILDHMQQAVFTVGDDGLVRRDFSAHSREIFGNIEMAGRSLTDLLQLERVADAEKRSRMAFWLANIFGSDELQWMLTEADRLAEILYRRPMSDGSVEERLLKLEYAPIYKHGSVDRVMVIAKDVTEFSRLQAEVTRQAEENRRNLERASQLAAMDPELFDTFSSESEFLLSMAEALLSGGDDTLAPDVVHELFRVVHTFKGNARIFKLAALQDEAHAAEDTLSQARSRPESVGRAQVEEIRTRFATLRRTLEEIKGLAAQVLRRQFDGPAGASGPQLKIPESRLLQLRQTWKAITMTFNDVGVFMR